ncbi:MAG TPA: hypothetical protein VMU04_25315 [Candidatus Acidoferrum sp.]|nr:hypothetical protein [Candidatus Acidoferrum sp.]
MKIVSSLECAQNCQAKKRWAAMLLGAGTLALALAGAGCATTSGPPSEIQARQHAVLLLRVVTEVEGRIAPPFPSSILPTDNVAIGVGDFFSGGKIRAATLRFLSGDTRKEGWAYLLLEPGQVYYLAAHAPISTSAWKYEALWAVCPRWSVEVPANTWLVYAGTLYLPGKGQWRLFGGRQLVEVDQRRAEVRDESGQAEEIAKQWLPGLGHMSVQLARKWEPGDTIILQTPPGK